MAKRDRAVRVVSIAGDGYFRMRIPKEELLDLMLERLEFASSYRPDIACLPELFAWGREAEPVPGPLTERVGAWAKKKSCYVICPMYAKEGEFVFNAAVLIDRAGQIAGTYHKMHITEGGLKRGECPGAAEPPVFQTDFGAIGMQICFDVNWQGGWRRLKEKGAEIVFFPSAYPAARLLAAYAWMNEFYIVSSTLTRPSSIYDISGEVLSASGSYQPWARATLALGKRLFEIDFNIGKMREVERKYGERVEVCWQHQEDWVTLASRDPDHLSVEELCREFEIVPKREYHERCEAAQEQAVASRKTISKTQV